MMMPTLCMASLSSLGGAPKVLGGDCAEDFIQPARLQVQLLELQSLARGELRYSRQYGGPCSRQRGQARIAHTDFNFRDRRKSGHRGARGLELIRFFELECHGVVVAGFGFERLWSVI